MISSDREGVSASYGCYKDVANSLLGVYNIPSMARFLDVLVVAAH